MELNQEETIMNTVYENIYSLDEYDATASIKCPSCEEVYTVTADEARDCPHCLGSTTTCPDGYFVTEKKTAPIKLKIVGRREKQNLNALDLLRTVGMKSFVEYLDMFEAGLPHDEIIDTMMQGHGYTFNSASTKTSTGMCIIKEGRTVEALEVVSNATNVSESLRVDAINLLKTRQFKK